MIDPRTEETAALYALSLLRGRERQKFEEQLEKDAELSAYVQSLNNDLALLALHAPPVPPPPNVLPKILRSIDLEARGRPRHLFAYINRIPTAWPLAASLFLSFTVLFLVAERAGMGILPPHPESETTVTAGALVQERIQQLAKLAEEKAELFRMLEQSQENLWRSEQTLDEWEQELDSLRHERERISRELQKMTDIAAMYRVSHPNMSRLTVIELTAKPLKQGESSLLDHLLPSVYEGIAAELGVPGMVPLRGLEIPQISRDLPDLAMGPFRIGEGPQTAGPVPPTPTDALSLAADSASISMWGAEMGDPAVLAGPTVEKGDRQSQETVYEPSGFVVYESGRGVLSVFDLPKPPARKVYQAWVSDPARDAPLNAGTMVLLEDGSGRFAFQLPDAQVQPNDFFITVEPEGGSSLPTGEVILSGWSEARK